MKQILKILLVVVAVGGISYSVYHFLHGIESSDSQKVIATTDFEKHIQQRIDGEIIDKGYEEASHSFDDIYAEIITESSITKADGTPLLSTEEIKKSMKMVFVYYVNIFVDYEKNYYSKPAWEGNKVDSLRQRARQLLEMDIAEANSSVMNDLQLTINTANAYDDAVSVVNSASHCTSKTAVDNVLDKWKRYRSLVPLTNCSTLMGQLSGACATAKNSYASHLINLAESLARNRSNYSFYEDFLESYRSKTNLIDQYVRAYGNREKFSAVQSKLEEANEWAVNNLPLRNDNF